MPSSITGSIAGNTLTVATISQGTLFVGSVLTGSYFTATISALGTGTGGVGTYQIAGIPQTIPVTSMTGTGAETFQTTNVVEGLEHLQGKTVTAVGDGAQLNPGIVPSNGTVNLGFYAQQVVIGLPYETIIEPMNPIIGSPQATSKSKRQKFKRAEVSLYQSIGGKIGINQGSLYDMPYGTGFTGQTPSLFTGNPAPFDLMGDWLYEATISVVHDIPFPFTLRSIVPRLSVADEG
jgi:hypothetical protein